MSSPPAVNDCGATDTAAVSGEMPVGLRARQLLIQHAFHRHRPKGRVADIAVAVGKRQFFGFHHQMDQFGLVGLKGEKIEV